MGGGDAVAIELSNIHTASTTDVSESKRLILSIVHSLIANRKIYFLLLMRFAH